MINTATWFLIMWFNGVNGAVAIHSVPFSSQEHCLAAKLRVLEKDQQGSHAMFAICVEK
jgi:hypothetical protein